MSPISDYGDIGKSREETETQYQRGGMAGDRFAGVANPVECVCEGVDRNRARQKEF